MARNARGKKSYAISDISGFKVKYTQLKTTWDNLRVEPEEWEPKHPQLTPAKNIIDATSLFNPRPNNDPENAEVVIGYNYDWTVDPRTINKSAPHGFGTVGFRSQDIATSFAVTGVGGTGGTGAEVVELAAVPGTSGLGGTGTVGVETFAISKSVTGPGGTGATGTEVVSLSISEAGVSGTGTTGTEVVSLSISEAGVSGTGGTGSESVTVNQEWGSGTWNDGTWGN